MNKPAKKSKVVELPKFEMCKEKIKKHLECSLKSLESSIRLHEGEMSRISKQIESMVFEKERILEMIDAVKD